MFSREQAEKELTARLNAEFHSDDDSLVILPDLTIEKDYGWIFFYQSRKYLETGDYRYQLAGNGPVAFEKASGEHHHLGSASPPHDRIREFEVRTKK